MNYLNGKEGLGGSAGSAWPPRGSDASLASFIVSAWLPGVVVAGLTGCPTLQYVWLCVLTGIIKDRHGSAEDVSPSLRICSLCVICTPLSLPPPLRPEFYWSHVCDHVLSVRFLFLEHLVYVTSSSISPHL